MRIFIIDTSNMGPELQGGMIAVVGTVVPTAEEKRDCIDAVSRYAQDGWTFAADPSTPIGRLAALAAETACVPFVSFERLAERARTGPILAVAQERGRELRR